MGLWTWSFETSPSASFVMRNYDCFRTWMMGQWTCHFEAFCPASFSITNDDCFWTWMMAQMGHWTGHPDGALDWPFWRRSFSFIPNDKLWLFPDLDGALDLEFSSCSFSFTRNEKLWSFPDLDAGTWMLGHWTCHFEAGPWPSFILNGKLWLLQDLNDGPDGALDSCRLDAGPSASYAMTNYHCFRTWIMGRWTCHLEAGPSARLHSQWQIMVVSGHGWWGMGLGVLKPILELHS